jgi:hypothetical protein
MQDNQVTIKAFIGYGCAVGMVTTPHVKNDSIYPPCEQDIV